MRSFKKDTISKGGRCAIRDTCFVSPGWGSIGVHHDSESDDFCACCVIYLADTEYIGRAADFLCLLAGRAIALFCLCAICVEGAARVGDAAQTRDGVGDAAIEADGSGDAWSSRSGCAPLIIYCIDANNAHAGVA